MIRIPFLLALALAILTGTSNAQGTRADGSVANEILLQLNNGQSISAVAATHRLTVLQQFGTRPIWRSRITAPDTVNATVTAMRADARVKFAEPHYLHQTPEARHFTVWAIGGSESEWGSQWAGPSIGLDQAHAVSTGAGVKVAVLDSGIDNTHPSLSGRLARNAQGQLLGRDFVNADSNPREMGRNTQPGFGHGTHVAGLLALAAPDAKIMPLRVLDPQGRGNVWVLGEALMYAVDPDGNPLTNDGARVINMSLGTTRPTSFLDRVVELATCSDDDDDEDEDSLSDPGFEADAQRCNNGGAAVVISAAGNAGNSTQLVFPAAEQAEGALSVAASRPDRRLADFSNRGRWIQIAAPGEGLVSTFPWSTWSTFSGTSMAAPLVSGVAALLLQANPDWKPVDVTQRILDRSRRMCGNNWLRQVDAAGAVLDFVPPDPNC